MNCKEAATVYCASCKGCGQVVVQVWECDGSTDGEGMDCPDCGNCDDGDVSVVEGTTGDECSTQSFPVCVAMVFNQIIIKGARRTT